MAARAFSDLIGRQLRTSSGKADSRVKLIRAVRAAARRMGLDDDDRRALQLEVTGTGSLGDMTIAQIGQVLDRLNRDRPAPSGQRAHVAKVRALWWTLYWLGEIAEPNDAALDAFVRRQTGLSALRFLDHRNAPAVIEALKSWAHRAGVRWRSPADAAETIALNPGLTLGSLDRHAVLAAIYNRLRDRGRVSAFGYEAYVQAALKLGCNHWAWTAHELDAAIRQLGKMLRRDLAKHASDARGDGRCA